MINLTIISSLLIGLSSGHAYINLKEARNYSTGDPIRQRYRNVDNKGAPCGGQGYTVDPFQKSPEPHYPIGSTENYPSMNGPSSKFGGAKMTVQPGSTFKMPIKFKAQHGGFHYAAGYCTGQGEAPPTESFLPTIPPGWTIFQLSANQPNRDAYEKEGVEYMTCDTYIPKNFGADAQIDLYYDIPDDFCAGQEDGEAVITWSWESDYSGRCFVDWYKKRCGQDDKKFEVKKNREKAVYHKNEQGKNVYSVVPSCEVGLREVWYNCVDVKVIKGSDKKAKKNEEENETTEPKTATTRGPTRRGEPDSTSGPARKRETDMTTDGPTRKTGESSMEEKEDVTAKPETRTTTTLRRKSEDKKDNLKNLITDLEQLKTDAREISGDDFEQLNEKVKQLITDAREIISTISNNQKKK